MRFKGDAAGKQTRVAPEQFVRRRFVALILILGCVALAAARSDKKDKDKEKTAPAQAVDSGSFGVFVKGQRVATESFTIHQQNTTSIIKSQLKQEGGPSSQRSELEITSNGEIIRYDWTQASGGSLTVLPNNEFLIEKISVANSNKPAEQSFLMPNTSSILDNNFFVHREVLAWRYLASDCKPEAGGWKCERAPGDFGVLVPQDRMSLHIRMELVGDESVPIRGTKHDLLRLNLKGENVDWALWVDEHNQFKLMRVAIPADDTEVVRD
ncbi:MAG TPA: hypothetical protein VJQ54_23700 [Candidatus Sulfotelmatobacter sp.]|nr:hypothetical protein [Candidatus Sulfotelmatobacter sp.]